MTSKLMHIARLLFLVVITGSSIMASSGQVAVYLKPQEKQPTAGAAFKVIAANDSGQPITYCVNMSVSQDGKATDSSPFFVEQWDGERWLKMPVEGRAGFAATAHFFETLKARKTKQYKLKLDQPGTYRLSLPYLEGAHSAPDCHRLMSSELIAISESITVRARITGIEKKP